MKILYHILERFTPRKLAHLTILIFQKYDVYFFIIGWKIEILGPKMHGDFYLTQWWASTLPVPIPHPPYTKMQKVRDLTITSFP